MAVRSSFGRSSFLNLKGLFRKNYCTNSNVDGNVNNVCRVPLSQPLPGLLKPVYVTSSDKSTETRVTTLSNGLKVASENKFGQFCTVGVLIDSGSRYEAAFPLGISHFLERLSFNSTSKYESKDTILEELERHGGICDCQSSRDTMIYAVSAESSGLGPIVQMLSEVVLRPKITDTELNQTKQTIAYELEDLDLRPEKELILTEMIHAAAYRKNTLGLPKICPKENIGVIDRKTLFTYMKNYHVPNRMVLAGVGIEHSQLVEFAEKYFVEKPAIWIADQELSFNQPLKPDNSLSQYTGGIIKETKDLSDVSLGPTPMPELAHLVIAMESSSHQHQDFIPFCVLNTIMGGGGSFSAGGPGKGMYTRLYTNVLNRYHWMYNATAYNHAYNDSGIFCIHASAHPSQLKELSDVIIKEFVCMTGRISDSELERAKKQLQSMLLMNLEARPVIFEDLGRQVLASGHRKQSGYYIDKINKISTDDIQRVANEMLKSKLSVAALGNLERLPDYTNMQNGVLLKENTKRRFSLFR